MCRECVINDRSHCSAIKYDAQWSESLFLLDAHTRLKDCAKGKREIYTCHPESFKAMGMGMNDLSPVPANNNNNKFVYKLMYC